MKRGGSRMGYTEQFNLLSPCYKDGEQPAGFHMGGVKAKPTKKGTKAKATKAKKPSTKKTKTKPKQRGGSSCGASLSVAEMGVVDRPASLQATASELAWDNRMKGGDATLVGNVKPNNLFSLNIPTVNTKNSTVNTKNSTINTMTPTVNSNNSPLNKIKNELFPDGTTPELVMKLIQTNKNNKNPTDSTYSFEIFYRLEGNNEIKKSVKSDVKFGEFLTEYRKISTEVFPPPPPKNNKPKTQTNSTTNTTNLTKNNKQTQSNSTTKTNNLTKNNKTNPQVASINIFS